MSPTVYLVIKYLAYFLLAYLIYLVYTLIIYPYLQWKKYKKYSNVYTSETFTPIVGDMKLAVEDMKNGRPHYHHKMDEAKIIKNYDLRGYVEGTEFVLMVVSQKAMKEFVKLQPHSIDRLRAVKGLGSTAPYSWVNERTTQKIKDRRKNIFSLLNFNKGSKNIPMILKKSHEFVESVQNGQEIELMNQLSNLIFSITTAILFGGDTNKISKKLGLYKNPDGSYDEINMRDFQLRVTGEISEAYYHPLTIMFPYLNKYKLCNPFKRTHQNLLAWKKIVKELVNECNDENSVCHKIISCITSISSCKDMVASEGLSYREVLDDTMILMISGSETTARAATSLLYLLHKHPKILKKIKG